jgi:hypothetical protein
MRLDTALIRGQEYKLAYAGKLATNEPVKLKRGAQPSWIAGGPTVRRPTTRSAQ